MLSGCLTSATQITMTETEDDLTLYNVILASRHDLPPLLDTEQILASPRDDTAIRESSLSQLAWKSTEFQFDAMREAAGAELLYAPFKTPQWILNLGFSIPSWQQEVADKYPKAKLLYVDAGAEQPTFIFPNSSEVDNIQRYQKEIIHFDLVYGGQMVLGSNKDMPEYLRQSFNCCKPGGYFEIHILEWHLASDRATISADCPTQKWVRAMRKGKDIRELDFEGLASMMRGVGFVEVVCRPFKVPCGPWSVDHNLKEAGTLQLRAMQMGIDGFSRDVLQSQGLGSAESIAFLESVLKELSKDDRYFYWPCSVLYGQRPVTVEASCVNGGGPDESLGPKHPLELDQASIKHETGEAHLHPQECAAAPHDRPKKRRRLDDVTAWLSGTNFVIDADPTVNESDADPTVNESDADPTVNESEAESTVNELDEIPYQDSTFSEIATITSALDPYMSCPLQENNRTYHSYKPGKYMWPNDKKEQGRLLLQYMLFEDVLGDRVCITNFETPQSIIDFGTGTGEWAIAMADKYPHARVIGTDLSPIQPELVPLNLSFLIEDCTDEWTFPNSPDFIHMRSLGGSIKNWPELLRRCYLCLKPGGKVEIAEIRTNFWCDDNTIRKDSFVHQWLDGINQYYSQEGIKLDVIPEVPSWLKEAGFESIETLEYALPIGGWSDDPALKKRGERAWVVQDMNFESYGLAAYTRIGKWEIDEYQVLIAKARRDLRGMHLYTKVSFVTATKPS